MKPGTSSGSEGASEAAFSLLELLVVACIMMILGGLYFAPSGNRQARQMAQCQANLQGLYVAAELYSRENQEKFPARLGAVTSEQALEILVPRYTSDLRYFLCPGAGRGSLDPNTALSRQRINYACYMGRTLTPALPFVSDAQAGTNAAEKGDILFSLDGKGAGNNHQKNGGNVLLTDGSVQASSPHAEFSLGRGPGVVLVNPRQ